MGTPVEEIAEELSESGVTEVRQIGSKETGIYVLTFDMPTPTSACQMCLHETASGGICTKSNEVLQVPKVWPHNEQMQQPIIVWQIEAVWKELIDELVGR